MRVALLVGYGADPAAVIDVIAGHAARGAIVIKGNHDEAIDKKQTRDLTDDAYAAIDWARLAASTSCAFRSVQSSR